MGRAQTNDGPLCQALHKHETTEPNVHVDGLTVYCQYLLGNFLGRRVLDELREIILQMAHSTVDVQRHL